MMLGGRHKSRLDTAGRRLSTLHVLSVIVNIGRQHGVLSLSELRYHGTSVKRGKSATQYTELP